MYNSYNDENRNIVRLRPEDDPQIRSNIELFSKGPKNQKRWLKSERAKKILRKIIKEACYCIAGTYVIYCIIVIFSGITLDSRAALDLLIYGGGLAFVSFVSGLMTKSSHPEV